METRDFEVFADAVPDEGIYQNTAELRITARDRK